MRTGQGEGKQPFGQKPGGASLPFIEATVAAGDVGHARVCGAVLVYAVGCLVLCCCQRVLAQLIPVQRQHEQPVAERRELLLLSGGSCC